MTITVTPERFTLVDYDPRQITDLVARLRDEIGLRPDLPIHVEVDETTPMGKTSVAGLDPVVLALESGALEDPKRPRQFSPVGAAEAFGRLLFRLRDRLDPEFGEPPPDADISLARSTAWNSYAVGRFARLGYAPQRQRRLYHFRIRHGFTDAADAAFSRLWGGDGLTWHDIVRLSDEAAAASAA